MDWLAGLTALVVAPLAGGFLRGIDRRITARMQGRLGPPVWQAFYDFWKLWGQNSAGSLRHAVWVWGYLLFTIIAVFLLFARQNLLMIVMVLVLAGVCLALGAFSVSSPYAQLAAHRELIQLLAYAPLLLLTVTAIVLQTGTFQVAAVKAHQPDLLLSLPLVLVALLVVLVIKLRKSPFDMAATERVHQELGRGIFTEYSGRRLAISELTNWYELVLVLGLIALFAAQSWWAGLLLALTVYLGAIVLDNLTARLAWGWSLAVSWLGVGLILLNIVLAG